MSGRRAKAVRDLARLYRTHLAQISDPEQRREDVQLWVWAHGQTSGRGEARLLRRYLRGTG